MFLFPPFHASGIIRQLILGITNGVCSVTPPPAGTPGQVVEGMVEALQWLYDKGNDGMGKGAKMEVVALPPPHAEYLGSKPELLDRVARTVKSVFCSGGVISLAAGRAIVRRMQLINDIGSTEMGLWPSLVRSVWTGEDKDDTWRYIPLHPSVNVRLDPVSTSSEGEICEAVMQRNEESGWVQPLFRIPQFAGKEVKEKSLGDLFVRHPEQPELLRHAGRADEVLNFGSEKYHPVAVESAIAAHPGVKECVLVGTGRARAALVVRLRDGADVGAVWEVGCCA